VRWRTLANELRGNRKLQSEALRRDAFCTCTAPAILLAHETATLRAMRRERAKSPFTRSQQTWTRTRAQRSSG